MSIDSCVRATPGESTRAEEINSTAAIEERGSLLAYMFESSDDAIISKTLDGVITTWNKAAERIFGYAALEAVNRNISIIEVPNRQDETDDDLEQIRKGQRIDHYQTIRRRKDGNRIDIWLTVSPLRDSSSQIIGALLVARDITEVKRAEEELRQLAENLRRSNADLLRSNQELDSFAYIASHDLKEPLRGIHNYATFLLEDYTDKLDLDGRSKLETLRVLAERMYALIDSLLEYSRVGRVDLAIKKTDLSVVLDEVLLTLRMSLDERGVEVRVPVPLPIIKCDHVRIGEVFRNLITNAIKYNDKAEKWIEITWYIEPASQSLPSLSPQSGVQARPVVFSVRDNGIGVGPRHLDSIFRIFKRLHARDKFGGGTGVGLTIAQKVVERHGGRIWVESTLGEGTTFAFTLGGKDTENGCTTSNPGH